MGRTQFHPDDPGMDADDYMKAGRTLSIVRLDNETVRCSMCANWSSGAPALKVRAEEQSGHYIYCEPCVRSMAIAAGMIGQ